MKDLIFYRLGDSWDTTESIIEDEKLFTSLSESDVLSIVDEFGFSNLDRIYSMYGYSKQEEYKSDYEKQKKLLVAKKTLSWTPKYIVGTLLLIPRDKINRAVAARDGGANQLGKEGEYRTINDAEGFIGREIESIVTSPGYNKLTIDTPDINIKKEQPAVQVFIWCRGLRDEAETEDTNPRATKVGSVQDIDSSGLYGRWIDVSKYVSGVNISVGDSGGSFNIDLPPVQGLYNKETQSWDIDRDTIVEYSNSIIAKSSFYTRSSGKRERTEFFFKNAISNNDLVFISFEKLELDKGRGSYVGDNIIRSADIYPGSGNWDLIGLVDSVKQSYSSSSNELSIQIKGRDLSKLIIDDGSYMFPLLFDEHNFIHKDSRLVNRNLDDGSYRYYSESKHRTVRDAVQWIINIVSNIRIIPDNIAESAGGDSEGLKEVVLTKNTAQGLTGLAREKCFVYIYSIFKKYSPLDPDSVVRAVEMFDTLKEIIESKINDSGEKGIDLKYIDYYTPLIKVVQLPQPGTFTLSSSKYRGQTFEGKEGDILKLVKCVFDYISLSNKSRDPTEVITSVGGGIWRFVKLIFDETIQDRKLADVSLGRPDGSLINLIWNYAQSPWIEFFMDTWGSSFYFMFRTPPWNRKLIIEHYNNGWIDNVVIEAGDVLEEDLEFDTEMYTMFSIDYKAGAWGNQTLLASVIPTIPFPELAEIWGNRRLSVSTNMLPFNSVEDKNGPANRSYVRDRGIDDLIFVVDTTIYKPFTRKGSLVVNGDRRLKKGTWFYYESTKEIFYITSVAHSYNSSLDRVTTVQVERGMVLEYVNGGRSIEVDGETVELSYFNIVNTEKIASTLKRQLEPLEEKVSSSKSVVQDVYNNLEFEKSRAKILSTSFPSLNKLGDLLKSTPSDSVRLEGHTDSDGSESFNLDLSRRRVESVSLYLTKYGVGKSNIKTAFFGEVKPVADNSTKEGRAKNRRVDIFIEKGESEESTSSTKEKGEKSESDSKSIFRVNRPVLNFFLQKRQFGGDKVVIDGER